MKKNFETNAIRTQSTRTNNREHSVPLYLTSSFVFEDAEQARALFADEIAGNIYTRFSNPNNNELIEKLCLLEGTEDGIATASGMAAMYSSMAALLKAGDHVLASRSVFGSTHQILNTLFPRFNISYTYADIADPASWESKIQPNTKMIFVETPSNPALDIIDLEWLGKLATNTTLFECGQLFCYSVFAKSGQVGCSFSNTLGNQIYRWPGQGYCRSCTWKKRTDQRSPFLCPPYRTGSFAIQCVGAFQKFGNTCCAHGQALCAGT
jgi:hypothetical protein